MKISYVIQSLYCCLFSTIFFLFGNIAFGQTLTSDKEDYAPGTTAILTGSGFQAGEDVEMKVHHADAIPDTGADHDSWMIVADLEGNFVTTWHVCEDDCDGSLLRASADGQSSGLHAEVLFTDAQDQPPECIFVISLGNDTTILFPTVPVFTPPSAIDVCDSPVYVIVVSDDTIPGDFPGRYSRTVCWAATDNSGNESETICQTINVVNDTTPHTGTPVTSCVSYTLPWGQDVTATDDYSHTYTSVNGFDSTVIIHVTINPGYDIAGASVTACGSYTLSWGQSVNVIGDYSHTYSSVNGCDSLVTIHVTINPAYEIAGAPVTACGTYTLPWSIVVTSSGDYSHTYSSVNGCDSVFTVNVIINPLPTATASNNGPLCTGGTLNLSSTGGSALPGLTPDLGAVANFILFTSVGAVSNTDISQITGNIGSNAGAITGFETSNVTGSFHNADSVTAQCAADLLAAYTVLNNTAPTNTSHAPAFGSGETLFAGVYSIGGAGSVAGNLTLDAQEDPNALFIFKIGGAFTTGASTTITLANGATASNVFWVAEGAISMAAVTTMKGTLIANNGAISMGDGGSLEGRMYSTTGAASVYAVTASMPINASSLTAPYTWTGPNGFTSSLQNPGIGNVTIEAAGSYIVTVTNSSGCSATATTSVTVDTNPALTLAENNSICSGATATIDAGAGYASYMWSTGATTQTISVSTAGTYTVTVSNPSGCTATATTSVTAQTNPTATASSNSPVSGGNTLNLTSSGGTSYSWTGPNGFVSTLQNPSISGITYLAAGTYTVVVTNSYGCTDTATTTVVTNCSGFKSFTFTQGGWGATANGNNPAVYRNAYFALAFPTGLSMGCGAYWLYLTSSLAVQNFLPSGGTPGALTQTYIDPGYLLSNTFAGQITALVLNVGFDNYDANFAPTSMKLKDLYVKSGPFTGWTVQQVLNESQKKLGGCPSAYTVSQLNTACTNINENYDGGTTDKGYLSCMPLRIANEPSVTGTNNLNLYPNPSRGVFVIELNLEEDITAAVDIQVLNLLGQIIYVNQGNVIDGILRHEVQFDNNLPNGNYLIRVIAGDQLFTEQVIYQK